MFFTLFALRQMCSTCVEYCRRSCCFLLARVVEVPGVATLARATLACVDEVVKEVCTKSSCFLARESTQ